MKEIVMDWAAQGLKPKRIYNALLPRFNLTKRTAPSVASVQRFAHYHVTGRLGRSTLLDAVRQKIKDRGFTCHEEEAAAFTFTSRSDRDGKPITGNGSDSDPFVVGISSKKLLRRADRDPESFIFHLGATYKLTQVGYPVVVVGISDRARRFHLVAIFIVSQQQRQNFAEILGMLAHTYMSVTGKPLRVRYVMGDADAAQWSAINDVFGEECNYMCLMCYFHVAKKVFDKTRSLPPAMAASVMEAIHKMHFAASESAYLKVLDEAQENWSKLPELKRFSQFFSKVWLNQRFWRWQCFHTPSGFATTNNPCETYNAMIKRDVTLRRKLKVGALLPQLLILCESESTTARPFATSPEADARLLRRVRAMNQAGLLQMTSASRCTIAFLLVSTPEEDQQDVVHVVSRASPRGVDEVRRRTVEDLPVTAQLSKLTALMVISGMPTTGWPVDMKTGVCQCPFANKHGCCIHAIYALECRGAIDTKGREMLVNRGPTAWKGRESKQGRPRNSGAPLAME